MEEGITSPLNFGFCFALLKLIIVALDWKLGCDFASGIVKFSGSADAEVYRQMLGYFDCLPLLYKFFHDLFFVMNSSQPDCFHARPL